MPPPSALTKEAPELKMIIAGRGGQGVVFVTRLLAETSAALGWPTMVSEVHGMAQRGGSVVSHINIGNGAAPLIHRGRADLLIALDLNEALRSLPFLRPGAVAIVNTRENPSGDVGEHLQRLQIDWVAAPADKIALDSGAARAVNIALIGFAFAHPSLPLPIEGVRQALGNVSLPQQATNLLALNQGYSAGLKAFHPHPSPGESQSKVMDGLVLNEDLLRLPLYIAGKSAEEIAEESGLKGILKLNSNESALGPSPRAMAALRGSLDHAHRYPGIAERELRRSLAKYYGKHETLREENFLIGNGGTDILRMIAQGFVFGGRETVTCSVTFPLYALLTTMFGGTAIKVAPCGDYRFDLDAMASAITGRTSLMWLCSPNNPTGYVLAQDEMDALLAGLPEHVVAVIDEAYQEYVTDPGGVNSLRYVSQGKKVIVVRSFSKSAGLANLRIGFGIAHPDLIQYLLRTVLPFNTGALAMCAAAASLEDQEYRARSQSVVDAERNYLHQSLSEARLNCLASQANFILVIDPPGGAPYWCDALLRYGVVVRLMTGFGLSNAFRVTIGKHTENERFLEAIKIVLAEVAAAEAEAILPNDAKNHAVLLQAR